mgnify:CR=1 FL=1
MARWVLCAMGLLTLAVAAGVLVAGAKEFQTEAWVAAACGFALLLSSAFGRPVWVITLVVTSLGY